MIFIFECIVVGWEVECLSPPAYIKNYTIRFVFQLENPLAINFLLFKRKKGWEAKFDSSPSHLVTSFQCLCIATFLHRWWFWTRIN